MEAFVRSLDDLKNNEVINDLNVYYYECKNPSLESIKNTKGFKNFCSPRLIYHSDSYYWFKCNFSINKIDKNNNAYFCVDIPTDIPDSRIRRAGIKYFEGKRKLFRNTEDFLLPQGLLYLNGKLIQAIDINHSEVKIDKNGKYEMYLYLYSDNFDNAYHLDFSVKYRDKRIEQAYYDFLCVLENLDVITPTNRQYPKLINIVNEAINIVDLRNKDEKFFNSLAKARKIIKNKYFIEQGGKENYFINCVGHSHIDMAWLWDVEQTRLKSQRTFSTVLNLMSEYPEYKFTHTSPQLFEFLKRDNPKLYSAVKKRIKEGRFEVEGAMWVEPDCNLTSGESLVRQILYGKEFMKKEFGIDSKILFLPDVFGYAYQIPQILDKSGVKQFSTTKIGWNDTNRFPLNPFKWVGLDGTSVFAYLISTCTADPRRGINDTDGTSYNGNMLASELLGTWNRYQNKKYNNVVYTTYGYGDGGGGPTREMLEKQRRFSYGLPGMGKTRPASLTSTLKEIERNFNASCKKYKHTPTWKDELYLEYHRGTYTSVPWIKKANRDTEFLMANTEILASLNSIENKTTYPQKDIETAYKKLLLNQFHDILPGSSIKKVYDDARIDFAKIHKIDHEIINSSLKKLTSKFKSKYIGFNPNYFEGNYPIMINGICFVKTLPAFSIKSIEKKTCENKIKLGNKSMQNEFFEIKFNNSGDITYLYDKKTKKQIVARNSAINKFVIYEDIPFKWDNWEISPYYKQKNYQIKTQAKFTKIDEGDRKGFKIIRTYGKSKFEQRVYLYNKIDRIDFENSIDWNEKRQMLKVHFPLNVVAKQMRCDVQFGSIGRNTIPKNKFDEAKFEVCAQKWVDMSDGKYGVAILNNGKYGHSANGNDLALTIVKSGNYPNPHATDDVPDFTFSIYPHKGNYKNSDIVKQAYALNRPPILHVKPGNYKYFDEVKAYIELNSNGVVIETFKKANKDRSYILRGFESQGKKQKVELKPKFKLKEAYICDLLENEQRKLKVLNNKLEFEVKPFEIFTIKLK